MRRLLAIVNPCSGNGAGAKAAGQLQAEASEREIKVEVLRTESAGHATELARQQPLEGFDGLVSVGGDGTLHEVLNGLCGRPDGKRIPVGIVPAGTGDSLSRDLGCPEVEEAVRQILSGSRRELDLFQVEAEGRTWVGFNLIGCGLPSRINSRAEASRGFKGLRYQIGILKALIRYRPEAVTVTVGDTGEEWVTDFLVITNTRHIGGGIRIAPEAVLDDGELDLVLLKPCSRLDLLGLLLKLARGIHLRDPRVVSRRVTDCRIRLPSGSEVNLDGEQRDFRELKVRMLPRRIELMHEP